MKNEFKKKKEDCKLYRKILRMSQKKLRKLKNKKKKFPNCKWQLNKNEKKINIVKKII